MSEANGQKEEPELNQCGKGTAMTIAEKTYFWARPSILAIASVPFAVLILYAARTGRFEGLLHQRLFLYLTLPILFLWSLIALIFKRMIRRRVDTGYYLPTGKELKRLRARRVFWMKITFVAYFCVIAILCTQTAMHASHLRAKGWVVLALVWMIVAFVSVMASRPSGIKLALAAVAAQFCLVAISCTLTASHSRHNQGAAWAIAILMWMITAGFAVWSLRPPAQKTALPIAPEEPEAKQGDESR